MQINNIDRVLCFAKESGQVRSLESLEGRYGFEPDGTNFYYGINPTNRDRFNGDGEALNRFSHRQLRIEGGTVRVFDPARRGQR